MDNNNLTPENIEVPSLDTIQDLPEVEMPKLDEVQPSPAEPLQQVPDAQAIPQPQAMPQPQAIPQVPTYPQPPVYPQVPTYPQQQAYPQVQPIRQVQSVPKPSVSYAPTNQAVFVRKRSGGQIACLVIGIILAVINIFFEFVLIVGYANNALPSDVMLVMTLFFGVFLFVGILFIIGGARKGTKLVSVGLPQNNATLPVQTSYGMPYSSVPYQATPVQTAPVQTAAPVPAATSVQTAAPTPVQTTVPVQEAAPIQTEVPVAEATPFPAAAPIQTDAPDQQQSPVDPTSTSTAFNYAPTAVLTDESVSVAKKSARKSAFISMGVVVLMWVVLIALAWITDKWYLPWYLMLISVICAISAIKNYPKSVSAWISLVVSILSIIVYIGFTILLNVTF